MELFVWYLVPASGCLLTRSGMLSPISVEDFLVLLEMIFWFLTVLFILAGVGYVYCALSAISYAKTGKAWVIWIPLWLFMPSFFEERGNRYRVGALKVAFLMGVDVGIIAILGSYLY
ncbi:hypothetical protein H0Z60_09780 [Ectothiorhodospiraceae bacterium WFHF3C12]|nr:hypothetical protein [Ectothiorhodospiraceae bacterium WFHF3C12]